VISEKYLGFKFMPYIAEIKGWIIIKAEPNDLAFDNI